MNKFFSNPCIRCGTQRVVVKTWEEKVGISVIVNTLTACPDADCQKKVDMSNRKDRERTASLKMRSEQRMMNKRNSKHKVS